MAYVDVNVQFVPNRRGGQNLCYQGNIFSIKSRRGDSIHWRCCKPSCPSRINTASGIITTYRDNHDHVPAPRVGPHIGVDVNDMVLQTKCRHIPTIYQEKTTRKKINESTHSEEDDLSPSHNTMKQIRVGENGNKSNSESLNTVTYHPTFVGIESVKIETIDSSESKISSCDSLESNLFTDIPQNRGKANNQSKADDRSDGKLDSCSSESVASDNANFQSLPGPKPPLNTPETYRDTVENINVKKDRTLCNDIRKSNSEDNNMSVFDNTQVDDETLISLDSESESSNNGDPSPLFGIELVKKEIVVCLRPKHALKHPESNADPLDNKNGKSVCGSENLKNYSKTSDFKSVDISQCSVKGKSASSNSSVDNCVIHTDSPLLSNSLTKYPGANQTVSPLSSGSESASSGDHTEITEPFAGMIYDPVSDSISTTQSLRKVFDKRMDDAHRDSGSRRNKRKGDPSKLPPEKRNCSSLDRLTHMCEQDDPTSDNNYILDQIMTQGIPPEYLRTETKEINKTKSKNVPETQHNPRFVMGNERPPPEYTRYLDQTQNIPPVHGNMHSGFPFRRDHFRFNEGHGHFPYMIPDQVCPPAFHMSNRYNHSVPHPQHFPFPHGCNTDRPVTDQDYLRQVMRHEEMYHASRMSLIESDKACGEAEHATKVKLIAAQLEVVELQKLYWKKRMEHISDKDSDINENYNLAN